MFSHKIFTFQELMISGVIIVTLDHYVVYVNRCEKRMPLAARLRKAIYESKWNHNIIARIYDSLSRGRLKFFVS